MVSNQSSAFTPPVNGANVLVNFQEELDSSFSLPFLGNINISQFANLNWTTSSYIGDSSKNTYVSTAGTKGKISITTTTSGSDSTSGYTKDFKLESGLGDVFTFGTKQNSTSSGRNSNTREEVAVTYNYVGNTGTADDFLLNLTFSDVSSSNNTDERYVWNGNGPFSMNYSDAEFTFVMEGSYTGSNSYKINVGSEKDSDVHTIKKFELTDKTTDFSLSFSGTLSQNYLANTETADLRKITINNKGIRIDTASLTNTFNGVGFFLDTDNEITNSEEIYLTNHLLPAVLKENNVITGNSDDNIIYGSQGNDRINGGAGNDTLDLSRFNWSLNDGEADSYSVTGNEKSFTITHRDDKTHTMTVSNVEFVTIGGGTYSVTKFLNPLATEVNGGYFLEQLIEAQNRGQIPGALLAIELSGFATDDWTSSVYNPSAPRSNLKFKTTDGNTLSYSQTQSTGKNSTILDFASTNGDRLNFRRSEEESLSSTRTSFKETDQLNWKYVGDKSTTSDDVAIIFSRSDNYTNTLLSSGITNTIGMYSVSLNYSDAYYKLNGAMTNKYDINSNQTGQFSTTFSRYSFEDLISGFKISLTGKEIIDPFTNMGTWDFKKLNVSNQDIIVNTASFFKEGELPEEVMLGLSDEEMLGSIEDSIMDNISDLILTSNNIITIKNNDGYTVFADAGNDKVTGGMGSDFISGGKGKDTIAGGLGADIFIISGENLTNADVDIISDFNILQGDKIYFDTSTTGITFNESTFALTPGLKNIPANAEIFYDQQRGNLYYDVDGSGSESAILIASFSNKVGLTSDSFMSDDL